MPFFTHCNAQQIQTYCRSQPLGELHRLNHRFGAFFSNCSTTEDTNNRRIQQIEARTQTLKIMIEENKEAIRLAEERRQHTLSTLPGNGAERHLMLNTLIGYGVEDKSPHYESEIKRLDVEKELCQRGNAWIKYEIAACIKELKILNAVIKEKELDEQLQANTVYTH